MRQKTSDTRGNLVRGADTLSSGLGSRETPTLRRALAASDPAGTARGGRAGCLLAVLPGPGSPAHASALLSAQFLGALGVPVSVVPAYPGE